METKKFQHPSSITTTVLFPYKGGTHIVKPDQIIRLEAVSNYTRIFFADRKPILMAKVLTAYQHLLAPYGFVRVHRSHLVNPLYVQEINDGGQIIMRNEGKLEISRRRKLEVVKTFASTFHIACSFSA